MQSYRQPRVLLFYFCFDFDPEAIMTKSALLRKKILTVIPRVPPGKTRVIGNP